ncbi:MAG: hypothetical protein HY774_05600 [Acidobacteria bacterium]|nr:hypothetical protein [Acidobacteriota bacterium]
MQPWKNVASSPPPGQPPPTAAGRAGKRWEMTRIPRARRLALGYEPAPSSWAENQKLLQLLTGIYNRFQSYVKP